MVDETLSFPQARVVTQITPGEKIHRAKGGTPIEGAVTDNLKDGGNAMRERDVPPPKPKSP
jgi:hypothetical protein